MDSDHPCYPHKATCDWCRICRRGDCCAGDHEEQPADSLTVAVGKPLVSRSE